MNIISSARLSYKLMTKEDGELLFQLDQDPEVMRFITGGNPSSMEQINNTLVPSNLNKQANLNRPPIIIWLFFVLH